MQSHCLTLDRAFGLFLQSAPRLQRRVPIGFFQIVERLGIAIRELETIRCQLRRPFESFVQRSVDRLAGPLPTLQKLLLRLRQNGAELVMIERLVRLELDRRDVVRRRLQGLAVLRQHIAQLVLHQRNIRIELIRLQQHRCRFLAHVDLAEKKSISRKPGRKTRVVAHQEFVLVRNRPDLGAKRTFVEVIPLLHRLRKHVALPLRDPAQGALGEILGPEHRPLA